MAGEILILSPTQSLEGMALCRLGPPLAILLDILATFCIFLHHSIIWRMDVDLCCFLFFGREITEAHRRLT